MQRQNINNRWQLHEGSLSYQITDLGKVQSYKEGWFDLNLPSDVRMPLIENGIIKDPVK